MRVRIGQLDVDRVTFAQALDEIERLVAERAGGAVFTPNIDHVVNAEANSAFREAYARARLSLVDGKPLLWAARLLGEPLPEKISGSDLLLPLVDRAAARGWSLYLLGGPPGVAERSAELFRERHGAKIAGFDAPRIAADGGCEPDVLERIRAAKPDLLLVALGSPKQELFLDRHAAALAPAVGLGIGASLEFAVGAVKRAPRWMSNAGLEWLYRLSQDPKRLWRRYLVNDPKFALILFRTWRAR